MGGPRKVLSFEGGDEPRDGQILQEPVEQAEAVVPPARAVPIQVAGFFWFVWQPLGKGLLFIAVFTCVWTAAVVLSTLREAGLRNKERKE